MEKLLKRTLIVALLNISVTLLHILAVKSDKTIESQKFAGTTHTYIE